MNPYIAVISAGRPDRVAPMLALTAGARLRWYVGNGERAAYEGAGATVIGEGKLCVARNMALADAFGEGRVCVQVSDDLKKLEWTSDGESRHEDSFTAAVAMLQNAVTGGTPGARLAGVAPTNNLFFYPAGRPVSTDKFIVGDFFAVAPSTPRFTTELRLKEDYDFTLQHLAAYGKVARVNGILATFAHRTNKGGAVAYRTESVEQKAIAWLKARWPGCIHDNPRRPNEVLLRWTPQVSLFA